MKKLISIFFVAVSLLSVFCLCSCGKYNEELNEFVNYTVTKNGVIKWNKIKEAKYYYIVFGSDEKWVEENSFDASSYFDSENGHFAFSIKAFKSKNISGFLNVEPIDDVVVKINNNYSLGSETAEYTLSFNTDDDTHGKTNLAKLDSKMGYVINIPQLLEVDGYDFNGWYYDKEKTQKVTGDTVYITSDTTLYADISIKICKVTVFIDTNDKVIGKTFDVEYGSSITEKDMPTPNYESGYVFKKWITYKSIFTYDVTFPYKVTSDLNVYAYFIKN